MIRTLWVGIVAFVSTVYHSSGAVVSSWRKGPHMMHECESWGRSWARSIIRAAGVKVVVEGVENLSNDRSQVVVSNHQSWFDVFALIGYLPGHFRFVAKQELGRIPIFGAAWRGCGHISLDREDRAQAIDALTDVGEQLRRERLSVVVFPEGTRSSDGELRRFKKGAFVLAIQSSVCIVPVAVLGTYQIMPRHSWRVRPGEIVVRVGKPISTEGFSFEDRDRLVELAKEQVALLMEGEPQS